MSISRNRLGSQLRANGNAAVRGFGAALLLAGSWVTVAAADPACTAALAAQGSSPKALKTVGTEPAVTTLSLSPGHAYLIQVDEQGNDALVEVLDPTNQLIARADHPERRTGTRRAVVTAPDTGDLTVRVTGTEHAQARGTAAVRAFDLAPLGAHPECVAALKALAQADSDYAAGQEIIQGRAIAAKYSAHDAFQRAADGYATAERTLTSSDDQELRGQTQLALAALEYYGLQAWDKTAAWGKTAARTLQERDPYRSARAESLVGSAWIEIATADSLRDARAHGERLQRFYLRRGYRYDAGLQLTNIGLTYLYQSRFPQCVNASLESARLFGEIHEALRRAQAWQNAGLCLWGLGRMPEALRWFDRSLKDIGPAPYTRIYLASVTNTALANYAVGHFDESLRLYDLALPYAKQVQSPRDEASCLDGIGLNYYALGDHERAREFLERALAIRSAALDARGRMTTLRALAAIDAEQGRLDEALTADREALSLAVGSSSVGRVKIQLAAHAAAAGQADQAMTQLQEVLAGSIGAEPVIKAEALLQRAVLLRAMGRSREALADLRVAQQRLHQLGGVTEEFVAYVELARTQRALGQPHAALLAINQALDLSDAVRAQTVNPEFRALLETPLRSAYDLKVELLRAGFDDAKAAGRVAEADRLAWASFGVADASRARSLADVAAQEYSPELRKALAAELKRREELYRELAGRRYILQSHVDYATSRDARSRRLFADIAELERQVDAVNTVIATHTSRGGVRHSAEVRARLPNLPPDSALVSYWLGADSAYAWVVTGSGIQWQRLRSTTAIVDAAMGLHRALRRWIDTPPERRRDQARLLYGAIMQPLEPWLGRARQWIIVPDGALDYVPFAALRLADGGSDPYVIGHHDVALTPAAWMLESADPARSVHEPGRLLLVADPVYEPDDPRLGEAGPAPGGTLPTSGEHGFQRLPFTAQEAAAIAAQFPAGDIDELIGTSATRDRLLSLDWSRYRFIHIAAHGIVDAQVPQLSGLILGLYDDHARPIDGAVRVADLSLKKLTADVVTFSACDTALGQQLPSEGLVGLSSTVLARGARAVVASLWPVSDEIGAHLMTDFYRHLLHDSMSPPAALSAAMRTIVTRDPSADPALWAAFQVSVVELRSGSSRSDMRPAQTAMTTKP